MAKNKRMERAERFKAGLPVEDDGVAVGQQSRQIMDLDNNDEKIKARMERFGGAEAEQKQKKGALEFTLDEYKAKKNSKLGHKKDKFNKKNGFKNKQGGFN